MVGAERVPSTDAPARCDELYRRVDEAWEISIPLVVDWDNAGTKEDSLRIALTTKPIVAVDTRMDVSVD